MNEPTNEKNATSSNSVTDKNSTDLLYKYSDSGIQEREGKIPTWLIFVAIGLAVWSVYYTVVYWSP